MEERILSIHDNILSDDFIFYLNQTLDHGKWKFATTGGKDTKFPLGSEKQYRFWNMELFYQNDFNINDVDRDNKDLVFKLFQFFHFFTQKFYPQLDLIPLYLHCNGQTIGQDGHTHIDMMGKEGMNYTLMIMPNLRWEKEWGGQFEILKSVSQEASIIKTIEYKPGRVIFFDGLYPHRGIGPKIPNILRKTIVFKCKSYLNFKK